jgi:DNA polymerase III epsilon subunit-like protein
MVGVGPMGWDSRLASVSVVNEFGNQVYFSYAQTNKPVTDYRYKYSGIKKEHLANAPSFAQVQAEVKSFIEGHVIVGHSLENDFRALGFFPPRYLMRDTAHDVKRLLSRAGRPRKLRRITWEFLGMIIQDSDQGHDPCEDARAALLLYQRYEKEFEATAVRREAEYTAKQKVRDERLKAQ